jgi:pSer/pThr/pTyr-binding forkhead associated (FHA) protein
VARLVINSAESGNRVIELNLGVNRLGRSSKNDFPVEHPTVSAWHCEIVLTNEGVVVRDCGSANGTYVGGEPVKEAKLSAGQTLRLGEIELLVETTEVTIAIPSFEMPRPAPPVVLSDGSLICPRHPKQRVTHQCTHCREVLCDLCVHRLRRRGGRTMTFCPLCSHPCVPLGGEKKKKKSFFGLLHKTVKLPFFRGSKSL